MAGTMMDRGTQPYKRHRLPEKEAEVGEEIIILPRYPNLQWLEELPTEDHVSNLQWLDWLPTKLRHFGYYLGMKLNGIPMANLHWLHTVNLHNFRPHQVDQLLQIRGINWSSLSINFEERMYNSEILETESSYMQDSSDVDNYMQDSSDIDNNNLPLLSSTQKRQRTENTSSEWIFIVISLVLEGLSLAFDQIASPRKPYYGLIGMLLAIVALLVTTWELVRKTRKEIVKSRRRGMLRWFHYPHSHSSVYGTLPDIYGIFGGIAQFVCSAVQYAYLSRYAESPIQVSLLPAIFLLCLSTVKITESRHGTSGDAQPHICQICRQTW